MDPKVTLADDSNRIRLYDVVFHYAIGATESNGALSMLEVTVPAGTLIKPHMHTREDEFTLVLEGSVSARLGDEIVDRAVSTVDPMDTERAIRTKLIASAAAWRELLGKVD